MSSTTPSRPNGLALILFNDPKEPRPVKTKGATRGKTPASTWTPPPKLLKDISEEVNNFEVFLHHCTFTLESSDKRTVVRLDAKVLDSRPTHSVLPDVERAQDWKVVLSRYHYTVNPVDAPALMTQTFWILKLASIHRTPDFPYVQKGGEEYITSVVCFPQAWLPWISNEWFHQNTEKDWFMQDDDPFGVPTVQSTRDNESSSTQDGRKYFKLFSIPNTPTTGINQGETEAGVSEKSLIAPFTDSTHGIQFPADGQMYVILFDMPTNYLVARKDITDLRECVLCGDMRPHFDRGVVFGQCGHYLCYDCCIEYKKGITAATACYYCRAPAAINLDSLAENDEDEPQSKKSRPEPALSPGTQLKCMFSLLKKL